MRRKFVLLAGKLTILAIILTAVAVIPTAQAAPTYDYGFFYGHYLSPTCSSAGCNYGQVLNCGLLSNYSYCNTSTGIPVSALASGVTTKSGFINFISARIAAGGRDRIGAYFIIQTMRGLGGTRNSFPSTADIQDWKDRINNPAVSIAYTGNLHFSYNSGYQKLYGDDAYFPEAGYGSALEFKDSRGNVLYQLKANCGNPIGGLGLPVPPPTKWKLSGSTNSVSGSVYPGQSVRFTSSITNDNEGGTASFSYGPRYFYSNTSNPTRTPPAGYPGEIYDSRYPNKTGTLGPGKSYTNITEVITIPVTTASPYICGTVAFNPADSSGTQNGRSIARCYYINHPNISCGVASPSVVEPGQPFTVTATLIGTPANWSAIETYGRPSFFVEIYNSSGVKVPDAAVVSATRPASPGTTYTLTVPRSGLAPAGAYELSWGMNTTMPGASIRCPGGFNPSKPPGGGGNPTHNLDVAYKPYFTVTGGDIASNGSITSWNADNVGGVGYAGAGSQLAALATGNITSFVTGTGMGGNPSGLAFANTTAGGTKYGGGYTATSTTPVVSTTGATALGSAPALASLNGVYTRSGNLTLSGPMPAGKNVTIVLTSGDLYISGNITYPYGSLAQIPRLTVIVKNGNVYVNNNVAEIHGIFYIGGAGKGNFYSCATATGVPSTDYNTCNHPLTVYGAVTANKLILSRTYGSVHASIGVAAAPAENFYYSPEVWLAPITSTSGSSGLLYTSYVSLPPIL